MLDAVSTGLHPSAVIVQLAEKCGVSERCLWSDWWMGLRDLKESCNLEGAD